MSEKRPHVPIEDSEMFRAFKSVANFCWDACKSWDWFAKSTMGRQLVSCADSRGANLVDGAGRYGRADSLHFFVFARGSARETRYWLSLCAERGLIASESIDQQIVKLEGAARALNALIRYRRSTELQLRESRREYDPGKEDTRHNTQDIPEEHAFDPFDLEPDFSSELTEENYL